MAYGESNGHVTAMTLRDHERSSRDPNTLCLLLKAQYVENSWICYLIAIDIGCEVVA